MAETELEQRMRALPWTKTLGHAVSIAVFFAAYFWVMSHPFFVVRTVPALAPDRWVPLLPWTAWIYYSLWFYLCMPGMLMGSRRELGRLFLAALLLAVAGIAVFVLYPTQVPDWDHDWEALPRWFSFLKDPGFNGNACPSMHVGYSVLAGLWLADLQRNLGVRRRWRRAGLAWGLAIVVSTLTSKQHVVIDVIFGGLFGAVAFLCTRHWIPCRRSDPAPAGQTLKPR